MFNAKEQPVEAVQEMGHVMKFVNEALAKMTLGERLSPEAMHGLRCLLTKLEMDLRVAGQELAVWRKVSGPATLNSESFRKSKETKTAT